MGLDRFHEALRHDVRSGDGPEGDHEDHLARGLEAEFHGADGLGVVGPAEFHVGRRVSARVVDKVEYGGGQARARAHQGDVAVELEVRDAFLRGFEFDF